MNKWFENVVPCKDSNYISSRIRLVRNWDEYPFPSRLNSQQSAELVSRLQYGLDGIDEAAGGYLTATGLDRIRETDRFAMRERRMFNGVIAESKKPVGLLYSPGEDISIVLNGEDHIRLQCLDAGLKLRELWTRADRIDDFINSRFSYAFDEKYGYLTSFPTNVGTGLKANVVLHLPALARAGSLTNIVEGMSRFGVTIRGVYGQGKGNFGALYDISNSKTLGVSEQEIIDLVNNIAIQLNDQENKARAMLNAEKEIDRLDDIYRAYGNLKHARKMTLKAALMYMSNLMSGVSDGMIELSEPVSIYALMLGIQPANLLQHADRPLNEAELEVARAKYIRENLPELKEAKHG